MSIRLSHINEGLTVDLVDRFTANDLNAVAFYLESSNLPIRHMLVNTNRSRPQISIADCGAGGIRLGSALAAHGAPIAVLYPDEVLMSPVEYRIIDSCIFNKMPKIGQFDSPKDAHYWLGTRLHS